MLMSISWLVLNLTSTQGHACLLTVERPFPIGVTYVTPRDPS
jgi:hypothetical protein